MSCELRPALIEYHFGVIAAGERAAVEAHLPACADCVREFVALKRAAELADDSVRVSDVARARLRAAVADELHPPRRRWERPLALACAVAVTLFAMAATQAITDAPGQPPLGDRAE